MNKIKILKKSLASNLWTDEPSSIKPYTIEQRGNLEGNSYLLLKPKTTSDVSKIVKICKKHKIAIVPQGGRTGLCGGTVPNKNGEEVLISTEKMNKVINLDKENYNIIVQAGCTLNKIKKFAENNNRLFPVTLPSEGTCTIGGNIATNAGGSSVLKYGMIKDLVEGLEVVMPDGQILDLIKDIKKDNRGFDPKYIFVGSEGALGIITKAKLKLFPEIKNKSMAIVAINNIEDSIDFLTMIKSMYFEYLSAYELNSKIGMSLIKKHFSNIPIPFQNNYSWYVIFELTSTEKINLEKIIDDIIHDGINKKIIMDAIRPQNIKQYNDIWNTREYLSQAQKIEGPSIKHDISIPVNNIPEFLKKSKKKLAEIPNQNLLAFGHLADGNIHFNVSKPKKYSVADFYKIKKIINKTIFDLVFELKGSFSAEHGIGKIKKIEFKKYSNKNEFMLKKNIKKIIDPSNIMNPGKLF
ncbi:MAG: hydroxyacid dehydrogenase [Rickettsiales bacterium]|nr:hydroxyacid dehydrogenase [Rickettsiales bacterium]